MPVFLYEGQKEDLKRIGADFHLEPPLQEHLNKKLNSRIHIPQ